MADNNNADYSNTTDNNKKNITDNKTYNVSDINAEELQKELDSEIPNKSDPVKNLDSKLKSLISKEIKAYQRKEKTRAAEMITIFAAHNYYANGFTPVELRTTLEDLGPTYVKIGQIMSSRVDLLPEDFCKELEKLRENVKPLDPEVARAVIEKETGKKIDEIYSEFRDEPLGSASIGQTHYAVLKDATRVVTKVQRPLIADMMRKDYVLLKKLAKMVNLVKDNDDPQKIDLLSVIEELEKVTNEELDFRIEAENTRFFKENCINNEEEITCPFVIDEITTERIFTMTYVDGYTLSHKEKIEADGINPMDICTSIANNFMYQVFDVGTFHADPHQGNIMISNGKPYWIDFGMIGHVSNKSINTISDIVVALLGADADKLVKCIISMGATSSRTNRDKLMDDADMLLKKYTGYTDLSDFDMDTLYNEISDLCSRNYITVPGEYTMLGRAIITLEGVVEHLAPDINLFKLLSEKMIERMKKNFDIKNTLLDAGKEILKTGTKTAKIPGLTADALNSLVNGRTKVNMELKGTEEPLKKIGIYIKYVMLIIISCVMFTGACILSSVDIKPKTDNGIPILAVLFFIFSIALAIYSVIKISNK